MASLVMEGAIWLAASGLLVWLARRLRASERRYRHLVENSLGLICSHDLQGRLLSINPEAARLLGRERADAVGRSVAEVLAPSVRQLFPEYLERVRRKGSDSGVMRVLTADGSERLWLYRNVVFEDRVLGHAIDVTELHQVKQELERIQKDLERRVAERTAALEASESLFRTLSVCSPVGIFRADSEGRMSYLNPVARGLLELGEDDSPASWIRVVHPDDQDRVVAGWTESARQGLPISQEFRLAPEGRPVTWAQLTSAPLTGDQERLLGYVGVLEDITERRLLESQVRQEQKMEALGQLAGGIAHDFNNILAAIQGHSELLLEYLEPAHPLRGDAEQIRKGAERAAQLTRRLLAFRGRQPLRPAILDLNTVLAGLTPALRRVIGEDIGLQTVMGASLRPISADPALLEQVVLNLIVNARDAMPEGGRLSIATANVDLDDSYARGHPGATAGSYVQLAVSDTGPGMDEQTRSRLFDPFFTTKGAGRSGLDLSIVYGFVRQTRGHIDVESEPGHGSTLRIYLPAASAAPASEGDAAPPLADPAAGSRTILLVEDEEAVRAVVGHFLRHAGYTILEAGDAEEALRIADDHAGPLHLLVTDVVLPGLNGRELFKRLGPSRPDLRVVFMSGDTGASELAGPWLSKPFGRDDLLRAVQEELR